MTSLAFLKMTIVMKAMKTASMVILVPHRPDSWVGYSSEDEADVEQSLLQGTLDSDDGSGPSSITNDPDFHAISDEEHGRRKVLQVGGAQSLVLSVCKAHPACIACCI